MQFRKGDKVRVLANHWDLSCPAGTITEVTRNSTGDAVWVKGINATEEVCYFEENSLELIEECTCVISDLRYNRGCTCGVEKKETRVFDSGAVRDSNEGKSRPDLISPYMLEALGNVMAKGANKYGDRNWERGMPPEVFKESAARHYVAWMMDKTDEDHACQLIFNVMAWVHFRDKK